MKIKDIEVIQCIIKSQVDGNSDKKAYFFYPTKRVVLSISTNTQELFIDLDRIAQSFCYEP